MAIDNKIVTVRRLQQFKDLLLGVENNDQYPGYIYDKKYINENTAKINGDGTKTFSCNELRVHGKTQGKENRYINFGYFDSDTGTVGEIPNVTLLLGCTTSGQDLQLRLYGNPPANTPRRILTNVDIDPTNVVLKSEFDPNTKADVANCNNVRYNINPYISVFKTLVPKQGQTITKSVIANNTLSVTGLDRLSISNGDIVWIDSVPSSNNEYSATAGFYYTRDVFGDVMSGIATAELIYVSTVYSDIMYYNKTTEQIGYFSGTVFNEITTSSGGSSIELNGEEYTIAGPEDINGIFNTTNTEP